MKNTKQILYRVLGRIRKLAQQPVLAVLEIISKFWCPIFVFMLICFGWYQFGLTLPASTENSLEKYGQYGDSFGPLTSLFTGLGFGGLIITLLFQQRQIRGQECAEEHQRQREAQAQYENILFRLLDTYRQTLLEVKVGVMTGRDVLQKSIARVNEGLKEEGVQGLPSDIQGRYDGNALTEIDRQKIDYLHYRNFKIVSTEIKPQGRLIDTFEVLLEHVLDGAPEHLLLTTYKRLVFAQITHIEYKYYFLVGLSRVDRAKLRDLIRRSGFLDYLPRSSLNSLHRQMYEDHWGIVLGNRSNPTGKFPMSHGRIRRAFRAHKVGGGDPKLTYISIDTRRSVLVDPLSIPPVDSGADQNKEEAS